MSCVDFCFCRISRNGLSSFSSHVSCLSLQNLCYPVSEGVVVRIVSVIVFHSCFPRLAFPPRRRRHRRLRNQHSQHRQHRIVPATTTTTTEGGVPGCSPCSRVLRHQDSERKKRFWIFSPIHPMSMFMKQMRTKWIYYWQEEIPEHRRRRHGTIILIRVLNTTTNGCTNRTKPTTTTTR